MTSVINDTLGFINSKRNEIKPEYTRSGKPVYTLRKYADMTDLDAEVLLNGGVMNLAEKVPTFGKSGNMLHTPRTSYAVNIEVAFDNRVHISEQEVNGKKEKVYTFVVDHRALMEQKSGHIYTPFVVGYVVGKGSGKEPKPEVRGIVHVKEEDFVNNFDSTFDQYAFEDIMELINKYRKEHGTAKIIDEITF